MKPRLLVIDDDIVMIKIYQACLKNQFEVEAETVASKGIQIATKMKPKAILLDLIMPNIDGFEVLMQLRNHPGTSNLPVICISGDNNDAARNRAYLLGAIGFIIKPPDPKTFADDISGFIASMNSTIESYDKKKKFHIAFNEFEKEVLIRDSIQEIINQKSSCIFLSWKDGRDFIRAEDETLIESDQFIYLKIKPSLVTKFPFMQDLTPIVEDIKKFTNQDLNSYTLILDEPSLLFNHDDSSNVKAKAFAFNEIFAKNFSSVLCFSTRSRDSKRDADLMSLAKSFFGEFN